MLQGKNGMYRYILKFKNSVVAKSKTSTWEN